MLPVDGGSARDLRAAVNPAGPARQLTGLYATTHRPDARAQAPGRRFLSLSCPEEEKRKGVATAVHPWCSQDGSEHRGELRGSGGPSRVACTTVISVVQEVIERGRPRADPAGDP
jgi:hypothetical protein